MLCKDCFKMIKKEKSYFISFLVISLLVFRFSEGFQGNKREYIITLICIITTLALIGIYLNGRMKMYKYVFCTIIILGGLSLLIQPILNIPDETTHFARAEIISEGEWKIDPSEQYFDTIKSVVDLQENCAQTIINATTVKEKKIDYTLKKVDHVAAANMTILYIPQAIGIGCAKIFNLNVIWMMWLARFMNLLMYAIMCSNAIRITPRLQKLLFFLAVFPMSIQQAASCSVDATINGSAILFVAFFLKLRYSDKIRIKEYVLLWGMGTFIAVAKVTNIFIAGLILLLPIKRKEEKTKELLCKICMVVSIVVIGALHYYYTTTFAPILQQTEYLTSMNVNSGAQIQYILNNFKDWLYYFVMTVFNQSWGYVEQLNVYGWLSYSCPFLSLIMVYMFGKLCAEEEGVNFSKIERLLIVLMVLGIYGATCLALYIGWSPVGNKEVLGVQGRYFIPMLVLLGMVLTIPQNSKKNINHDINVMMTIMLTNSMLINTAIRYY